MKLIMPYQKLSFNCIKSFENNLKICMPSLLIFSTCDIGQNYRLLRHAKSFSTLSDSHVTIFGPDISTLPKEIEKSDNINFSYLHIWHFPYFLDYVILPIQYLFIQFQCIYFYFRSSIKYDFVISTPWPLLDPIFSFILSRMFKAKLIFDISIFWYTDKKKSLTMRKMEKKVNRIAHFRICSTKASQVILKLFNLSSSIIHDPPGTQFYSEKVIKKEVFSFLDISERFLIAILMPTYDIEYLNTILDSFSKLDQQAVRAAFIIFGNPKIEKEVKSVINQNSNPPQGQKRSNNSPSSSNLKLRYSSLHFVPINTDAYADILSCCDIGILLNGSRYGFDYSPELTELVACGIPTIVGRGGCMTEVIEDGKNGFIFNSKKQFYEILKKIFVEKSVNLKLMKESMKNHSSSWDKEWKDFFGPLLDDIKTKKD